MNDCMVCVSFTAWSKNYIYLWNSSLIEIRKLDFHASAMKNNLYFQIRRPCIIFSAPAARRIEIAQREQDKRLSFADASLVIRLAQRADFDGRNYRNPVYASSRHAVAKCDRFPKCITSLFLPGSAQTRTDEIFGGF